MMSCPRCSFDKDSIFYEDYVGCRTKFKMLIFDFCPKCGEKLREKCLECGEMERVDRKVCEKILADAQKKRIEFVSKKIRNLSGRHSWLEIFAHFLTATIWVSAVVLLVVSMFESGIGEYLTFSAIALLAIGFILSKRFKKYFRSNDAKMRLDEEKAVQEFFRLHPEYVEIIKKAESADIEAIADKGGEK